jgi:hypothetical protein
LVPVRRLAAKLSLASSASPMIPPIGAGVKPLGIAGRCQKGAQGISPPWLHFQPGRPRPPLIEIPSALAFRSIVLTDVLNLAAISDAVAPFAAIAITSRRSFFRVNRPGLRLPTIPTISGLSARSRPGAGSLPRVLEVGHG